MKNTFIGLHEALSTISTKGQDTITMANCLTAIRQQIRKLDKIENTETQKTSDENLSGEFAETNEAQDETTENLKK